MSLLNTYHFISNHPLTRNCKLSTLQRWLRWQIGSRVLGWPVAVPFVDNTRLLARPGMTGATGNIYCGLHEYEDMAFVLHFLRAGDLFVDIGANIGSYTILASAAGASVISFVPVPTTFEALLDNIHLNRLEAPVEAKNQAVGKVDGELQMIADQDTTNQALLPEDSYTGQTICVPMVSLDSTLQGRVPKLIKIDVEGFETEVLSGASETFADPGLLAVVMELNGSGARYGYDEDALHEHLQSIGFRPCRYDPAERELFDLHGGRSGSGNTMYLRNPDAARTIVKNAPTHQVLEGIL